MSFLVDDNHHLETLARAMHCWISPPAGDSCLSGGLMSSRPVLALRSTAMKRARMDPAVLGREAHITMSIAHREVPRLWFELQAEAVAPEI